MNSPGLSAVERPIPTNDRGLWGSDVLAEMLRSLNVKYVALNPGSSFRGLHDSLVNRLGNHNPQLLLCLHEEHAIALAHGYPVCIENLIRFDCVAASHNVSEWSR